MGVDLVVAAEAAVTVGIVAVDVVVGGAANTNGGVRHVLLDRALTRRRIEG